MATADLGWCIARCRVATGADSTDIETELVVCSPASQDEPAVSISILGLSSILALRDLIDAEVAAAEHRIELDKDIPQ